MFSCVAIAIQRRSDATVISRMFFPPTVTTPVWGSASRSSRDMRVDFPVPVGPTIAVMLPGDDARLMSDRTGRRWS